jgi:cGMP-dependent protein kinase
LQKALGSSLLHVIYRNSLRISFDRCVALRKLGREQWEQLIAAMRISSHAQGQVIIPAGTRQDAALWVVLRGELALRGSTEVLASTFTVVGEAEFSSSERYAEDVIVKSDVADVARMSREELEECLGGSLAVATMHSQALDVLARILLLRGLSREKQKSLLQAMQLRTYADKEVVVRQDDPGDSFFIIESGRVEVIKNGITIRTITKLDYFGERSMLSNEVRSATIVAIGNVQCWVMDRAHFNQLIDQNIRKQLQKRIMLQDDSILLQDLVYVKTLGRGMFGVVVLAVHSDTGNRYALKSVSRAKVVKFHLKQNMLLERNILMQLDHTLIVKLIKTFKDLTHMHFLIEYVRGMDFFDVLRKMDALLTGDEARFYVVCLMIILDHLHERDIIYRDLKPENVMIDEDGYPKLIDFGTAKIATRTYTIIGTPHYMAPEVVMGKGYNSAADYWSVGIMLFEMTCGRVPFGDEEEDPFRIYECILQGQPVYPGWVKPAAVAQVRPVVDMLLNRNPSMRLGGSMAHFRKLSWFAGLSWVRTTQDSLLDKQVKSPFVPQLEDLEVQVTAALQRRLPVTEAVAHEDPAIIDHESQPWEEDF